MRSLLRVSKLLVLSAFLCSLISLMACNTSNPNGNKEPVASAKTINKPALLNLMIDLAKSMSASHASEAEIARVLKPYIVTYKINVSGNGKKFSNSPDYLSLYTLKNERDTTKVFLLTLKLPNTLKSTLTFTDLRNKFGNWEKVPVGARPMNATFIITSFNYREAPGVSITVSSSKLPESDSNSIEQIEFSPSWL